MLSYEDCVELSDLTEEEIEAIALSSPAFVSQGTSGAIKRVILVPG